MVWCNALSEMQNLKPVYYTDPELENPIKNSTGPTSSKLQDYLITPGQVLIVIEINQDHKKVLILQLFLK